MDNATGKIIAGVSLSLAVGLTSVLLVSGEWLIAVGAIGGWLAALYLLHNIA